MIKSYQEKQNRKNLKDENYADLFEEPDNNELGCFDCETTGLNPKKADILSIGAILASRVHKRSVMHLCEVIEMADDALLIRLTS